ncbi:phospholipase A1-IIdelta [Magnolia sinica]|uniref:phospholipase A1-IIdelta n=1 Tax=Magnolia sinica TaxID=86752 RepID=UPI002658B255|nr:phospholipase A1-IIdelta [Magnolia sinica]
MAGTSAIEPSWPELLGSNQWEGLLDPLDLNLRQLVLRCGDFCQATYDAFNNDEHSKYTGSSRYGKRNFFHKVELESASNYDVFSFIYATAAIDVPEAFLLHSLSREAWSRESNWMGYVAVSTDEASRASGRREIYVVWRGTTRDLEWINVLDPKLVSIEPLLAKKDQQQQSHWYDHLLGHSSSSDDEDGPKVMKGWYTIYTSDDPKSSFTKLSARDQLLAKIKELVDLYKDEDLSITLVGHSLGACLAILSAFDIVENGLSKVGDKPEFPVCAIVFGSPQVGNKAFNERLKKLPSLRVLHVVNEIDLIPHYPSGLLSYTDTGVKLVIDTRKSSYLKDSKNPSDWHNLQGMLHIVAGWNGKDGEFELKVKRSIALVNKSSEFLTDECLVPGSWWVEKNKSMVLGEDGEWRLSSPLEDDIPVPEF